MVSAKTRVVNPQGMHMRPAQLLVNTLAVYPCEVTIHFGEKAVNAKSIMHLLAACIKQGSEIEIECDGGGGGEALQAALSLIELGLGE